MPRKYSQFSIHGLQSRYLEIRDDAEELVTLDHELSFRKTKKAKALQVDVQRRINELTKSDSGSSSNGHPDLFG